MTSGMSVTIDVRGEWRQLLHEAWRIERGLFLRSEHARGQIGPGVLKRYDAMLPDAGSRADVGFIIGEMIAELNVGHAYYQGKDNDPAPSVGVGMLGCDFTLENGAYKIGKIYRGGPWDTDAIGPLSLPGMKGRDGGLSARGERRSSTLPQDIWAAFVGLNDRVVTLTVSARPNLDSSARDVPVRLLGGDTNLRYREWIESNRKLVDKLSGGKVGYIYVPDTGEGDRPIWCGNSSVRQARKRCSSTTAGMAAGRSRTRFIELLNRPVTNYWARRDGKDWVWPPDGHSGPKAMLINGLAGSGGDAFPYYFKQAGLGKLIGTRTWGGLVGISGNPGLIDGSSVTARRSGSTKPTAPGE